MKLAAFAFLASLAAGASAQSPTMIEQGFEPGALGLSAIARGDWRVAEANLGAMRGVKGDDPARLINLGTVYLQTGRTAEAMAAWQRALAAKHHYMVETVDGRTLSTAQLAREALSRYALASR